MVVVYFHYVYLYRLQTKTFILSIVSRLARDLMASGERCGGLGSFLAMSCRGRAEAFARSLHSKLRSLGTQDENGSADESTWLAAHENPITISQPAHSTNTDSFLGEIHFLVDSMCLFYRLSFSLLIITYSISIYIYFE